MRPRLSSAAPGLLGLALARWPPLQIICACMCTHKHTHTPLNRGFALAACPLRARRAQACACAGGPPSCCCCCCWATVPGVQEAGDADTRGAPGSSGSSQAGSACPRAHALKPPPPGMHLPCPPPLTRRAVCGLSWAWPPRPRGLWAVQGPRAEPTRSLRGQDCRNRFLCPQLPLRLNPGAKGAAARGATPARAHAWRNCCSDWGCHWAARP
jgi:hypothetical protein